jgi:hypothetical protein
MLYRLWKNVEPGQCGRIQLVLLGKMGEIGSLRAFFERQYDKLKDGWGIAHPSGRIMPKNLRGDGCWDEVKEKKPDETPTLAPHPLTSLCALLPSPYWPSAHGLSHLGTGTSSDLAVNPQGPEQCLACVQLL